MVEATATATAAESRTAAWRAKAILGGSIGNLVEWYDWFTYSSFALYFAKVFFPAGDQTTQLLDAAAGFSVGFLARPIGSWILGVYADRAGRRAALVASMVVMALGSLVIAVLPGYDRIGFFAPLILVLSRVAQGLSVGGEYAASATYLSEVAGRKRRGFFASFQYVTLIMGQLLALAVLVLLQHVLSTESLQNWGWRVPFAIGAIVSVAAMVVMLDIKETQSFEAMRKRGTPVHTWRLMVGHPREFLIILGLTIGGSLGFYTFSNYIQQFLVNTSGFSKVTASSITAIAMIIFMVVQPLFGWLSDLVGRRALLIAYGGLGTIVTYPFLTWIGGTHSAVLALFLITVALLIQSSYTAISGVFKAELFPTEIRTLGVGLPFAIGVSIGGSAATVALAFKRAGNETWFYWYVTAFMAVAFVTALVSPDTQKHSKILED